MSKILTFKIVVNGYGGEICAVPVKRSTYEYFKNNSIDLNEFYNDYQNKLNVPEVHQFIQPSCFHSFEKIGKSRGADINESEKIEVYDEDGNLVWSQKLEIKNLINDGVKIKENIIFDADMEPDGSCIYIGHSILKGNLFDCKITTNTSFDASKMTLSVDTIDGWSLLTDVNYDNKNLSNTALCNEHIFTHHELLMIDNKNQIKDFQN